MSKTSFVKLAIGVVGLSAVTTLAHAGDNTILDKIRGSSASLYFKALGAHSEEGSFLPTKFMGLNPFASPFGAFSIDTPVFANIGPVQVQAGLILGYVGDNKDKDLYNSKGPVKPTKEEKKETSTSEGDETTVPEGSTTPSGSLDPLAQSVAPEDKTKPAEAETDKAKTKKAKVRANNEVSGALTQVAVKFGYDVLDNFRIFAQGGLGVVLPKENWKNVYGVVSLRGGGVYDFTPALSGQLAVHYYTPFDAYLNPHAGVTLGVQYNLK